MKIFIAQQNYIIGDIAYNTQKIATAIQQAIEQGGDLIVFPELSICGYPPRDLLIFEDFIEDCIQNIHSLLPLSHEIGILVGAPSKNPVLEGKSLHNSAYFLYQGAIQHIINKTLLPNYDIFDEYRYFEPSKETMVIPFKGKRLAVTICEDIWDIEEDPMYNFAPMEKLSLQQPDIIINMSASPFSYQHAANRKAAIKHNVQQYNCPMIYCNCTGAQTEIIFDGGSLVFDAKGNQLLELPYFQEALVPVYLQNDNTFDLQVQIPATQLQDTLMSPATLDPQMQIAQIHQALVYGIKEYFDKMGFKKALVASSGGIDSAVTLALACEALGSENVKALLLPSPYSTQHAIDDAVQLSKNLNNPYEIIPINNIFDAVNNSLKSVFEHTQEDVTEENIQSRIRGILAMALCNKFQYILLNTSNKSELATGYGTLYGDMAGGLAVLGDVFKLQVYALAQYINRHHEIIPIHILEKAPSAELRPDQKDEDSLPPYATLDAILYQYVVLFRSTKDIIDSGYDASLVHNIIQMVRKNEYKRQQFCPIIRVSSKAFGIGRRIPIVAKYRV